MTMNFTVLSVFLLCSFSWFALSVSDFRTVQAQPGGEVTLLCTNLTRQPCELIWFRVVKHLEVHGLGSKFEPSVSASYCAGFQNGSFEVTFNSSTVFLKIKQVNLSDAGLYFCGFDFNQTLVIVCTTYVEVEDGFAERMSMILGALTVVLTVAVIGLVVKVRKLQKAHTGRVPNTQRTESQSSDDELNYVAVTFHPKRESPEKQ